MPGACLLACQHPPCPGPPLPGEPPPRPPSPGLGPLLPGETLPETPFPLQVSHSPPAWDPSPQPRTPSSR